MRCALNNVLLFCFLSSAIGLASAVNCAPVDKDNTPLTGSQSNGGFVTCTYNGAGPCTYFPLDGSFSSGSSSCPHGLPQGGSGNVSTSAALPPVTSTSTPLPAPPVTTSTPSVSSTPPAPPPVTSAVITTTSSTPTTQTSPTASTTTSAPSSPPSNAAAPFAANSVLLVIGLAGAVVGINSF